MITKLTKERILRFTARKVTRAIYWILETLPRILNVETLKVTAVGNQYMPERLNQAAIDSDVTFRWRTCLVPFLVGMLVVSLSAGNWPCLIAFLLFFDRYNQSQVSSLSAPRPALSLAKTVSHPGTRKSGPVMDQEERFMREKLNPPYLDEQDGGELEPGLMDWQLAALWQKPHSQDLAS